MLSAIEKPKHVQNYEITAYLSLGAEVIEHS